MAECLVPGFKEGIELLPHQAAGRVWMRNREDASKKNYGGILADDMGLGKTIQALTRVVEGRAKKSDKYDGWNGSTLIVCPVALVDQWISEIKRVTDLKVLKHLGGNRSKDPQIFSSYHIVLTTYDTLKSEFISSLHQDEVDYEPVDKLQAKGGNAADPEFRRAIFDTQWWRILLDEAHNIKNEKTQVATACYAISSKFRWCLTGTPIQNSAIEFFSLIKFLRIKEFSDWDTFNKHIAQPFARSGKEASKAIACLQAVLDDIMLRRLKDEVLNGKSIVSLPQKSITVVGCEFSRPEKNIYEILEAELHSIFQKLIRNDASSQAYMSVITHLLRLRQACNHPALLSEKRAPIGHCVIEDASAPSEGCNVCQNCFKQTIDDGNKCPGCNPHFASAKIDKLLKLLHQIRARDPFPPEKTIVFSQFTKMLDLVGPFLIETGISFVRYDGTMSAKFRDEALEKIKHDPTITVILISLKAGSTGLNLTACNNVVLLDLWWNPAIEDQAFDRVHRIGQQRNVNIYKLVVRGTIEDRILLLQEKKRGFVAAALGGHESEDTKLSMDDLRVLCRPRVSMVDGF